MLRYTEEIWVQVKELEESLYELYKPLSNEFSLSIIGLRVLQKVKADGPLSMGKLAKSLFITGTNLSPLCKLLEKRNYLKRTRNRQDERVVEVCITAEGEAVTKECERQISEKIKRVPPLNKSDLEKLIYLLRNINLYFQAVKKAI